MNKNVTIQRDRKVVQSNPLIQSGYSLSNRSTRLIKTIISAIDDKRDQGVETYEFPTSNLLDLLGLEKKITHAYRERLIESLAELRSCKLIFEDEEKLVSTGWILKSHVYKKQDRTKIWIDGDLSPYLLDLKSRFTKYNLEEILHFRKEYTIRFYEWLIVDKWKGRSSPSGSWHISISLFEIRNRLGMLSNDKKEIVKHKRFQDLRRFVIDPAIIEISEKSNYMVSWEAIKKGKSYHEIKFHIEPKRTAPEPVKQIDSTERSTEDSLWQDCLRQAEKDVEATPIPKEGEWMKEQRIRKEASNLYIKWGGKDYENKL